VCTLLGACGQYFSRGSAGRRLDAFLVHFQRYVLAKPPLPLHVEFDIQVVTSSLLNARLSTGVGQSRGLGLCRMELSCSRFKTCQNCGRQRP
jgi:hypothetical protein